MTEEGNQSELEIRARDIMFKLKGSESFVKANLDTSLEIVSNLLNLVSSSRYDQGGSESDNPVKESESEQSPVVPKKPPVTISNDDWKLKIAESVGVSLTIINTTFTEDRDVILVDDWPLDGNTEERLREVALIAMYSNHIVTGKKEFTSKSITKSFQHLGIEYDHRKISEILCAHQGIRSPKPQWLKFNVQARKAAKNLLLRRKEELESI